MQKASSDSPCDESYHHSAPLRMQTIHDLIDIHPQEMHQMLHLYSTRMATTWHGHADMQDYDTTWHNLDTTWHANGPWHAKFLRIIYVPTKLRTCQKKLGPNCSSVPTCRKKYMPVPCQECILFSASTYYTVACKGTLLQKNPDAAWHGIFMTRHDTQKNITWHRATLSYIPHRWHSSHPRLRRNPEALLSFRPGPTSLASLWYHEEQYRTPEPASDSHDQQVRFAMQSCMGANFLGPALSPSIFLPSDVHQPARGNKGTKAQTLQKKWPTETHHSNTYFVRASSPNLCRSFEDFRNVQPCSNNRRLYCGHNSRRTAWMCTVGDPKRIAWVSVQRSVVCFSCWGAGHLLVLDLAVLHSRRPSSASSSQNLLQLGRKFGASCVSEPSRWMLLLVWW